MKDVLPFSEHRQCAKHIYDGFKQKWSGVFFQGLFWSAAKASYPVLFERCMKRIKIASPAAAKYLIDKDPKTWSRAFFELGRGCEAIENGYSECFNFVIVKVRNKPLITMLEANRTIVMERMGVLRTLADGWVHEICASIQNKLEWCKDQQR